MQIRYVVSCSLCMCVCFFSNDIIFQHLNRTTKQTWKIIIEARLILVSPNRIVRILTTCQCWFIFLSHNDHSIRKGERISNLIYTKLRKKPRVLRANFIENSFYWEIKTLFQNKWIDQFFPQKWLNWHGIVCEINITRFNSIKLYTRAPSFFLRASAIHFMRASAKIKIKEHHSHLFVGS